MPRLRFVVLATAMLAAAAWVHGFAPAPGAATAEIVARAEIKAEVARLLVAEDYASLERLAEDYRRHRGRTGSGVWKLTVFYAGIHDAAAASVGDEAGWMSLTRRLDNWRTHAPSSPTPIIALAIALKRYAQPRGTRTFVEQASSGGSALLDTLRAALTYLEANRARAGADPHFYVAWANLATTLSHDDAEFLAMVEEGARREPGYYQLYFAALDHFAPSQRGNVRGAEALANRAATLAGPEADAVYARIYWYGAEAHFGGDLLGRSLVDWDRMRRGIDAIVALYPNRWNIDNLARLACAAADARTTRALLSRSKDPPLMTVWRTHAAYASCRRLAGTAH